MAVRRRGKTFQVDVTLDGKRHRETFSTAEAAIDWEARAREAARFGKELPPLPTADGEMQQYSISHIVSEAKRKRWGYRSGSAKTVVNAEIFARWVGTKRPAKDALSEEVIHDFVHYLRDERRVSGATINRYLAAISVE